MSIKKELLSQLNIQQLKKLAEKKGISLLPPVIFIARLGYFAYLSENSVNLVNFEPNYLQNFPRSS